MTHSSNGIGDRGTAVTIALAMVVALAAASVGVVAADSTLAVETGAADADGEHTADVAANVTSLGSTGNATVWVEYRVADSSAGWSESANTTVSTTGPVQLRLTNLQRNTTYAYRAVAAERDGNDSAIGETRNLTTLAVDPVVYAEPAADVDESTATLNATLASLGDSWAVNVSFEYRPQGATTWQGTAAQRYTSTGTVTQPIDGLAANTTYEYRARAIDAEGDQDRSLVETFTTDSEFVVATRSATTVGDTRATLNGEVVDFGGATGATVGFEIRPRGATDTQTVNATLWNDGTFHGNVTGLQPGTTYEFYATGEATDGDTDTGAVLNVTTDSAPAVETGPASSVTESSATVSSNVTDLGGADSATVTIQYRQAGASTWQETAGQTVSTTGPVSFDLADLASGTDYEYRAALEASDGDSATGATGTFTTDSAESPPSVDDVTAFEDSPPNPHAELYVDWAVSDADGDLSTVTVEITDAWGQTVYSAQRAVGGSAASGSEYSEIKHGAGETYTVTVTVTDAAGNSDSTQVTVAV